MTVHGKQDEDENGKVAMRRPRAGQAKENRVEIVDFSISTQPV